MKHRNEELLHSGRVGANETCMYAKITASDIRQVKNPERQLCVTEFADTSGIFFLIPTYPEVN